LIFYISEKRGLTGNVVINHAHIDMCTDSIKNKTVNV
jgi:hypothetical protein